MGRLLVHLSVVLVLSAITVTGTSVFAADQSAEPVKQVDVHDPAMARDGDTYYLFSSGPGITFYSSKDMKTWTLEGRVFPDEPSWARRVAPLFNTHIWAPDIVKHDGKFYLYYSVSSCSPGAAEASASPWVRAGVSLTPMWASSGGGASFLTPNRS